MSCACAHVFDNITFFSSELSSLSSIFSAAIRRTIHQTCMFLMRILQDIELENRKTGRKRPRLLVNRRKLGQIDEKNARNPKKTLPGTKTVPGLSFARFWVKMRKSPKELQLAGGQISQFQKNLRWRRWSRGAVLGGPSSPLLLTTPSNAASVGNKLF